MEMFKEKMKNVLDILAIYLKKFKILIAIIVILACGCCFRNYQINKEKKEIEATINGNAEVKKSILINRNLYNKSVKEKKEYLLNNFDMDNFIISNEKAPVTIIDYSSYTCKFCKKMRAEMLKIIDEYVKEKKLVNYVLRPFYGVKTIPFGAFLLCVKPENRLEIAETFFSFDERDNLEKFLIETGKKYDLNEEYVKKCIHDEGNYERIVYMQNEGRKIFNLTKSPLLIINGKEYVGYKNYEEIKNILEGIIKHAR